VLLKEVEDVLKSTAANFDERGELVGLVEKLRGSLSKYALNRVYLIKPIISIS